MPRVLIEKREFGGSSESNESEAETLEAGGGYVAGELTCPGFSLGALRLLALVNWLACEIVVGPLLADLRAKSSFFLDKDTFPVGAETPPKIGSKQTRQVTAS